MNGTTDLEETALAYFVIKKCVGSVDAGREEYIGRIYDRMAAHRNDSIRAFRSTFVDPFSIYLHEHLVDQRVILSMLRRYKHKCEWFNREFLWNLWDQHSSEGEKRLNWHLYEYLYDQGIELSIEAKSISGAADLISLQDPKNPLVADGKIFDAGSRGKSYIAKGFNQIYLYTLDYNQLFGYLVIYNVSDRDIKFTFDSQEQSVPFILHNNKTIFILTIDIYQHPTTASKRGALQTIEITVEDLISIVNDD